MTLATSSIKVQILGDASGAKKAFGEVEASGGVFGTSMKNLAGVIAGVFAVDKIKDFAVGSVDAFRVFETGMNEVFTLLPGITTGAMSQMTKDVKQFAVDFRVLPQEVVPALYQALSAGVPPGNVFEFLETAQKAAKGGVADLTTAVDGISSVINAYGSNVISATQASDMMFTAVRLGKTTFAELSGSLFNVIPTAAALGVKFSDVTAGLAAMTSQGVPTSVATTQMRQLFVELSKEGSNTASTFQTLSGKSFKEFVASGGNVQTALQLMEQHAQTTGVGVNDLFGSVEAGSAALALTGQGTERFTQFLGEMNNSAGATDKAYAQMSEGVGAKLDTLKSKFEVFKLAVGEALVNAMYAAIPVVEGVRDAIGSLADFVERNQTPILIVAGLIGTLLTPAMIYMGVQATISAAKVVAAWIATQIAAARSAVQTVIVATLIVAGWVRMGIAATINAIKTGVAWVIASAGALAAGIAAGIAFAGMVAGWVLLGVQSLINAAKVAAAWLIALGPIGLVIAIVIGLVALIIANWDTIKAVTIAVWDAVVSAVVTAWNWIVEKVTAAVQWVWDKIVTAWNTIRDTTVAVFTAIWDAIRSAWDWVTDKISTAVETIKTWITDAWETIKTKTTTAFNNIKESVTTAFEDVVTFVKELPGKVTSAIGNLATTLYDKGKDLIQGLINGATNLLGKLGKLFLDVVPAFIREPFKAALGIESPSKVFAGYGHNIGEGLVQGIGDSQRAVATAMRGLGATTSFASAGFDGLSGGVISRGHSTPPQQSTHIEKHFHLNVNSRDAAPSLIEEFARFERVSAPL